MIVTVLFFVIATNVEIGHTRTVCNTIKTSMELHDTYCTVEEFWIKRMEDIAPLIANYSMYDDVLIIGWTGVLAKPILEAGKVFGNPSAILFNAFYSNIVAASAEMTAGAVAIAIEKFCKQQKKKFNFSFV